ncbi:MAG TPA: LamG-like jellyroll fold domain-containing protein, partial [Candidatus Sulfotelmatobacter sp.]|nr:LamG-like jellyroll fold domain-containing protein [Candidatus Sulfotelmatobacter sp.]
ERITATTVFPYSVYPVIIKITAKKDFSGQITEIVPSSFIISPLEKAIAYKSIQNQDTNQLILWNLSIKKGQSINIGYNYKAPLISPQFYLIGPLNMTSGGTKVFEEKRVWQLAIDDISYSSTIKTTPGLIAYYRLGETTGTTLTDSIGTSSGTYFNGPNLGQAGSIFRDQDTAVKFNSASSQYADVNNVPNWGAGPVTFELWYKMNTTSATDKGFLQRTDGVTADRWFFFRCGGTCTPTGAIKMGASASPIQTTNAAITDTNWHYIVAIKGTAANDWRIYVDGVNGGGTPPTFTAGNDFGIVKIGIDLANDFQDGTMDEVAIYNTALTESQILQHYNLGISTKYSYSSLILTTPGLASYWRLGETSGTTAVDSFGTNNGTYTNSPTLGFSGALAFDPDTAVDFNGSTQYVSIPDADYLSTVTNNALSVEFWTFPSGAVDGNVIVGKAASSNFEWALSRAGTTDFRLTTYQLGGATYDSTSSQGPNWPDNAWYHVVATMKAGDNKLYVNGNLYAIGDDGYTGSTGNGTSPVNIARRGDNSLYYNGAVDELAIYDTILTPDQIKAHYQAGINGLHTTFQGVKLQGIQVSN